jgi:hypothetical protein
MALLVWGMKVVVAVEGEGGYGHGVGCPVLDR